MSYSQNIIKWGIAMYFAMSLLSGCGEASPTPIIISEAPTSTPIPPPAPQLILPRATAVPTTGNTGPFAANPTATIEGTLAVEPSPTLADPIDRPFLMRIDRISVIAGRGTLLEGRVANGT